MTNDDFKEVERIARRHFLRWEGVCVDDMIQEGSLGWIQAEEKHPGKSPGYYCKAAYYKMIDHIRKEFGRTYNAETKRQKTERKKEEAKDRRDKLKIAIASVLNLSPQNKSKAVHRAVDEALIEISEEFCEGEVKQAKFLGIARNTLRMRKAELR